MGGGGDREREQERERGGEGEGRAWTQNMSLCAEPRMRVPAKPDPISNPLVAGIDSIACPSTACHSHPSHETACCQGMDGIACPSTAWPRPPATRIQT